ncbi:hypothetical protein NYR30_08330 [Gallibacterium salpingitidis]|uniref:hypothetical protein n=1 Tax=Gallibacterium salpingitidis TaxID=505341 RepID=UPI002670A089|nr:hypothetical protein [Gallibacterium salpingitidis]WKS98772.1 hypothetical protein NYR30_08330 [Gallibacterium salpingitidis]
MCKKYLSVLSHLFNWLLSIVIITIQFLLASNEETFTFSNITLTAEQLAFIAKMCFSILVARMIFYFLPQIKQWLGK